MKEALSQTALNHHRVEDPRACEVLTDRALLPVLAQFIGSENTIGNAAASLEMTVTAVYKLVKRFEHLGLLRVVRHEARIGRAIQYYQTVAETFFVPFRSYSIERISGQNWALHQAIFRRGLERLYHEERFVEQDWGVRTAIAENGQMYLKIVSGHGEAWDYLNPDAPAVLSGWNHVFLDFEDAKALQSELSAVLFKYMKKHGSRKHLVGVFLTDVDGLE
jgi:hypothetical protein